MPPPRPFTLRALIRRLAEAARRSGPPLLLLANPAVLADALWLRSGEKILGRVATEDSVKVVFESQALGRLEVSRERIERLERDPVPTVVPDPGTVTTSLPFNGSGPPESPTQRFLPWNGPSGPDAFDWIELKSGEWLKGRMKSLQNDRLDFDSEKLEAQEFDWNDVHTVRLPRPSAARFERGGSATGSLLVTTNEVLVLGAATHAYPRSELLGISSAADRELDHWSADLSAGLTLRAGNTRQADFNAQINIHRRTPSTHLSLGYLGNFGRNEGEEVAANHRITSEFDLFLSQRLFLLLPFVEYYRDPLQNLEHRLTAGGGAGYDLIATRRMEWNVIAGPAYQRNWFSSGNAAQETQAGAAALLLGSRFHIDLTSRLEFITQLRTQITRREVGETSYHSYSQLKFKIHRWLDLNLSLTWDRIADPRTNAQGVTPLRDDFRLITGLGIEL